MEAIWNAIKGNTAAITSLAATLLEKLTDIHARLDRLDRHLYLVEMDIETELPAQDEGWMSQVMTQANKDEARCIECGESDGNGWVIGAFAENMFPCGACNDDSPPMAYDDSDQT